MSSQALPLDISPKDYRPVKPLSPAEDAKAQRRLKDEGNLPRHIAIIMDGDRRWADEHNLPRTDGHRFLVASLRCCLNADQKVRF